VAVPPPPGRPLPAHPAGGGLRSGRLRILVCCEWACSAALAAFLVWILFRNLIYAPELWRDEITTLHVAAQPSLGELWSLVEWESLPLLWLLVVRGWIGLGFGADAESLRALAFIVGLGVIASLLFAAWRIARTLPLLGLLLVAANPTVIRFGDTLRAYGLGLVLAILLVAAFWRLAQRVDRARIAAASLVSILAVQCLYHDAVVVLALCSACAAAWAIRRQPRQAAVPLAIGAVTALTLLPYAGALLRAREWNVVFRVPIDLAWLIQRIRATVEVGGPWLSALWIGLAVSALALCALRLVRPADSDEPPVDQRARAAFFAVALLLGTAAYAAFLVVVSYPTQPWYYLSFLGLAAVGIEGGLALELRDRIGVRALRLGIVVAGFALAAAGIWQQSNLRMTNVDLIARTLEEQARADDLILVAPWYLGIAFDHYDSGATPWLSVPDVSDRSLTRYDLVKAQMLRPDAVRPIADRVSQTLASGARVWLVGSLPLLDGNPPPRAAPVAPDSPLGWSESAYQQLWSREVAHRLQRDARRVREIPIATPLAVSRYESPPLFLFEAEPTPRGPD